MSTHNPWQSLGPATLFAPTDKPERFAKAVDRADMMILDPEDGRRAENREVAHEAIVSCDLDPAHTIVRVNPPEAEDYAADIDMLRSTAFRQVMLPKASLAQQADELVAALGEKTQVIAPIETPPGAMRAEELAQAGSVVALFWGAEDLVAGLAGTSSRFSGGEAVLAPGRIHAGSYRSMAVHTRSHVHLAAAAHGEASLDSIYISISDTDGLVVEAADAAALGFVAIVYIHPGQVPTTRQAYRSSDEEIDWARRLLAEAEKSAGAFSFDGQMVDAPFFRQAEVIARRAAITGQSHGR